MSNTVTDESERAARNAIRVLNEALEADPQAMFDLLRHRAECNTAMLDHPTIQCRAFEEGPHGESAGTVSPLGLINGLFGVLPDGYGLIAAEYEKRDDGKFIPLRFVCTLDTGHSR